MKCIVTKSIYTENENFDGADVIVSDLDNGLDGLVTAEYLDYKAGANAFKPLQSRSDSADMFAVSAEEKIVDMFSKIAKVKSMNNGHYDRLPSPNRPL